MARTIKVPYFTVNAYGQLTIAGETIVSIPEGAVSWAEITGKPLVFPPEEHTHTPDEVGAVLTDSGADGESLIVDPNTLFLRRLEGARAASVYNTPTTSVVDVPYPYSAGIVDTSVPSFIDNGDGTATFSACNVALYDNDNHVGVPEVYAVPSATLSFTAGAQEYACITYNGGSPIWVTVSDPFLINGSSTALIYAIWRQDGGTEIHSADQDSLALGLPNKLNSRTLFCDPYGVVTLGGGVGPVAAETSVPVDRTILVSDSHVFKGTALEHVLAFNSSVDRLTKAVNTSGGWVFTDTPQYDNLNYNPSGAGEVLASNNKWIFRLYFRSIGDTKQVFYVESLDQYNTEAQARQASEVGRMDLPPLLTGHCILVGRSLIQYNEPTGITEAFVRTGGNFLAAIPNHNDLTNIQGGAVDEYYHLTARQHGTVGYTPHFMLMGS